MAREGGEKIYLIRDMSIIVISVILAVVLAKTGIIKDFVTSTQGIRFLGSFLAGVFFISVFTAAPSMVVLVEIARVNSAWEVAFFGGLGALAGDLIIFRFFKDSLAEDVLYLIKITGFKKLIPIFRSKFFKWTVPVLGALIIASPFPDELGLVMLGLSKTKTLIFVPLSFALNFSGILILGLIAKI
jgi:hypothetical protein